MRILITGGAGFIGSNFIRYILGRYPEYHIVNLDKLTYAGNPDNLKGVEGSKNYSFVKADICDAKAVGKAMDNCDWVVHFAAESHVDRSIADSAEFIKANVLGTHVLLEAARHRGIKKFIHISTDEVYGSCRQGFFKETDPFCPSSPYSASKAAADHLAYSYYTTYGLPVLITRSSNNFGPYQFPEKIIPLFITNLLENKKVPVYASGKNVRNWLFVEDNCRGIDVVLHKGKVGEAYNIGSDDHVSNITLTKKLLKNMKQPLSMIQYVADRPGHDFRYALDYKKIQKLGFKPQTSFEEALQKTIEWYCANPWWWQKLKKK